MKILHINDYIAPIGGAETYLLDLMRILESHGHQNALIYQKEHPRTPALNGISIYRWAPEIVKPTEIRIQLLEILVREKPDIVYLHDLFEPELVTRIIQMVPTVGYMHIFFPVCPGLAKLFKRGDQVCDRPYGAGCIPMIYLRRCASARNPLSVLRIMRSTKEFLDAYRSLPKVIVASRYMRDLTVENGFSADRIEILPYFINMPDTGQLAEPEPDSDPPGIFFAGRLEHVKGLPYLFKALHRMKNLSQLYIAGDGSLKSYYAQLARDMGLAHRVRFLGWLSDGQLDEYYRRCVVTVMPTLMPEPFGKVGVEAMANGRPVVAFDVGGMSDWLKDGHNGFLVPPRDVDQLASRLDQVLDNPSLAASLGTNGRLHVERNYSIARHIERLLVIFASAIETFKCT
jgi:glycosyltransferase involved in cell wall biosynthesis